METIKRKSGIRYRDMIWINGKPIKSPIFRRKTDCAKWLADQRSQKVELEIYGETLRLREKISVREYANQWLERKRLSALASSTLENYERYFRSHILPRIGDKQLKHIGRYDLERIQGELMKKHNPKGTNLITTVLKSLLADAVRDGYILRSPADSIKQLASDIVSEAFWTKSEIDQFLRANIRNPLYHIFLVALNTGMRKGELAGLKWDRVDFSLNQITITRTRDNESLKERTKTKLKRVIPMNQIVRATLLSLFHKRIRSDFVFVRSDDTPIDVHHLYRDFLKAQVIAKMSNKIRFHDLRHTFASQFMMNDGNLFDLQKILGHTDSKMTMRYAHCSPEHLHSAIKGFELGMLNEPNHILTTATNLASGGVVLLNAANS